MIHVLYLLCFVLLAKSAMIQANPTWVTNSYIQAASKAVINNVLTSNATTPMATFLFATAFSAVPNFGYGIYGYEGMLLIYRRQ